MLEILSIVLFAQWNSYAVKFLQKRVEMSSRWQVILQSVLNRALMEFAQKQDEAMVYFLLHIGAKMDAGRLSVVLRPDLSRALGNSDKAHGVYQLLCQYTHSGINEYKDNPEAFCKEILNDAQLAIPYKDWCAAYFYNSACSGAVSLWRALTAKKAETKDMTHATPLNKRNDVNQTVLIFAAFLNRLDDVEMFLAQGAHVNARDYWKRTALFYAARYASPKLVRALINAGAKISLRDADGKQPFEHALATGKIANALLLLFELKKQDNARCIDTCMPLSEGPLGNSMHSEAWTDLCLDLTFEISPFWKELDTLDYRALTKKAI